MGISNTELLRRVIDDIEELTRRGVIPDTVNGYSALKAVLTPLYYAELDREFEIGVGEGPDEHDPAEPRL